MKRIVLFSRCELVHLYGRLSPYLSERNNIVHVVYSDVEENILKIQYSINNCVNFKKEIQNIFAAEKLDLELCNIIDNVIIEYSHGRFNLNSAIQSDRTFQFTSYPDCLVLAQTYYKFWNNLIKSKNINYLLHEPTSLFFNHIAAIICKTQGAEYIAQIQVYGENKLNYLIVSGDEGSSREMLKNSPCCALTPEDRQRISGFLFEIRKSNNVFFNEITKKGTSFLRLIITSAKILTRSIKCRLTLFTHSYTPLEHVQKYFEIKGSDVSRIRQEWGAYFRKYDKYIKEAQYYYYPIHLEPEAVVLYWGDGFYKNQVKLIENIAAQLPANCFLYVKDHPHADAYRENIDYKRMKAIPNVKLLNPALPGKTIIKNSIGVITINGTSGFEALLNNKQVYTFGNSYYNHSNRVIYIANIKDLRGTLYANFNKRYNDDLDLFEFVNCFLKSVHEGFVGYFLNYPKIFGIDESKNTETVAKGLNNYFNDNTK